MSTDNKKLSAIDKPKGDDTEDNRVEKNNLLNNIKRKNEDKTKEIILKKSKPVIKFKKKSLITLKIKKPEETVLEKSDPAVATIFNPDNSEEDEDMPFEAKMRMRNIGKDTPTSSGPNSFNKGKDGFVDYERLWEKKFKDEIEKIGDN
ncbi:unnamed protein product [Gordionus sp. m RMFG-2023]|uniref:PEST proteolytic signal-containing nuclear protein-like n=1 Tax=Gordionus sp. m RMFG-2023 TaxID=3053472 RepID=UPI0030E4A451